MKKDYLYKVYDTDSVTVNQYIFDGNFEGWYDTNLDAYWQSSGSPTVMERGKVQAGYASAVGKGVELNGTTAYLQGSTYNSGVGYYVNQSAFTYTIRFYRANWQDASNHALVDHYREYTSWNGGSVKDGWGIYLNSETAGQLTFVCSLGSMFASAGGTKKTINYALTNLTSGWHDITVGSDGRYMKLWVDGVQVGSYDNGSNVGILDEDTTYTVGCQLKRLYTNPFTPPYTPNNFCDGVFDHDIYYQDTFLTDTQVAKQYILRVPQDLTTVDMVHYNESISSTTGNYTNGALASVFSGLTNNNGTVVDALSTSERALTIQTATGGSATQGAVQKTGTEANITGGETYTASCYVLATAGETINLTVTPTGGGSASTVSVVATGAWQNLVNKYVSNISATKLAVSITISNANASAKIFYVDKVALFSGGTAYDYFDEDTQGSGSTTYAFDSDIPAHILTFNTETYVATWRDVVSDFKYDQEINNAGSQLQVTLGRSTGDTGEGVDLAFGLLVKVYQVDTDHPTGLLVFNGKIINYTVSEDNDSVAVAIYGLGYELNNYLVTAGEKLVGIQPLYPVGLTPGYWGNAIAQSFTPQDDIDLKALYIMIDGNGSAGDRTVGLDIYKGDASLGRVNVTSGVATYDPGTGNDLIGSGSGSTTVQASTPSRLRVEFTDSLKLYAGITYFWVWTSLQGGNNIKTYGANDNTAVTALFGKGYAGLATINNASFGMDEVSQRYTELIDEFGSTTVTFNSYDPSAILRAILDDYQKQGGTLGYDLTSIPDTGTTVSYTFKSVTTFEALKKCLEFAPADWYFYIDQTENKVYFKHKSNTPDHYFVMGKHFSKLAFEKRTEEIVNVIYFTGGDLGGGINLFKVYTDQASIDLYGRRLLNYSDNRVTLETTADTLANTILQTKRQPEVRTPLEVLQNYPIDTVKPGDIVALRNNNNTVGEVSLWDIGNWDEMYWDYNLYDPSTYQFQIARFGRDGDSVSATLSTTPPDVSKRVEDINRNLEKQQTANNPDEPTNS